MAQHMVGVRKEAKGKLSSLAKRKRVSRQGLLSALVYMACGEADYGIIDLDWDKLRKDFPNVKNIQKKSWEAVLDAVCVLLEEDEDSTPESIAMRSRFTLKQVQRAMEELQP